MSATVDHERLRDVLDRLVLERAIPPEWMAEALRLVEADSVMVNACLRCCLCRAACRFVDISWERDLWVARQDAVGGEALGSGSTYTEATLTALEAVATKLEVR